MFAYCGNNPVSRKDSEGRFWLTVFLLSVTVVAFTLVLSGCSNEETTDPEDNGIFFNGYSDYDTAIPELTCEILHTFIQRVEVGERAKRYDRNAPQEIRIYYRDIGLIDEMPETMKAEKEKPTHTEVA